MLRARGTPNHILMVCHDGPDLAENVDGEEKEEKKTTRPLKASINIRVNAASVRPNPSPRIRAALKNRLWEASDLEPCFPGQASLSAASAWGPQNTQSVMAV